MQAGPVNWRLEPSKPLRMISRLSTDASETGCNPLWLTGLKALTNLGERREGKSRRAQAGLVIGVLSLGSTTENDIRLSINVNQRVVVMGVVLFG